ncbi:MAG: ATP-dependent 6-phosphofructokinase [Lentisphaeria bacterium]
MPKHIGILTSGGDCPGLNAAIRSLVRAGEHNGKMRFTGFMDGFRGLAFDRTLALTGDRLSGILTDGGTVLGTSRDKPHKMSADGEKVDMTEAICETYKRHKIDTLVCIGGGGTQKNARRLMKVGLNVVTLPKTIDNDIARTDTSIGYDTARSIATESIDRLHSTATSHNRVITVEIMGHRAGWLTLESGIAGGADIILLPEVPYDLAKVSEAVKARTVAGKRFSIVAVAEGAMSLDDAARIKDLVKSKKEADNKSEKRKISLQLEKIHAEHVDHTVKLTSDLESMTGQESRLSILGHLQRGGAPSAFDRILATRLGARCIQVIEDGETGVMVAVQGDKLKTVSLDKVAGNKNFVPVDHPLIIAARDLGTCFGD